MAIQKWIIAPRILLKIIKVTVNVVLISEVDRILAHVWELLLCLRIMADLLLLLLVL